MNYCLSSIYSSPPSSFFEINLKNIVLIIAFVSLVIFSILYGLEKKHQSTLLESENNDEYKKSKEKEKGLLAGLIISAIVFVFFLPVYYLLKKLLDKKEKKERKDSFVEENIFSEVDKEEEDLSFEDEYMQNIRDQELIDQEIKEDFEQLKPYFEGDAVVRNFLERCKKNTYPPRYLPPSYGKEEYGGYVVHPKNIPQADITVDPYNNPINPRELIPNACLTIDSQEYSQDLYY